MGRYLQVCSGVLGCGSWAGFRLSSSPPLSCWVELACCCRQPSVLPPQHPSCPPACHPPWPSPIAWQVRHYYYRLIKRLNKILGADSRLDIKNPLQVSSGGGGGPAALFTNTGGASVAPLAADAL